MPTRHGGSFWKNAKTYRRFNCRRVTTCPCASMPWTWNSDLAISRPIVVIVCMLGFSKLWGLNSTHIHGTHVPVEEPSTASLADSCIAANNVFEWEGNLLLRRYAI